MKQVTVAVLAVMAWWGTGSWPAASDGGSTAAAGASKSASPVQSVTVRVPRLKTPGQATLTLAAVGDVLLDRGVAESIRRFGIGFPFHHVAGVLSQADIAFGNLECPISESGTRVVKPFSFRARPADAECLKLAGFDILSLANNHTMDCGRSGLTETTEWLRRAGIRWCGAGETARAAESAPVLAARGIRVGFVAFCDFLPEGSFLNEDRPTIAFANPERVQEAVRKALRTADVVVASFHWGTERTHHRTARQTELARAAVDAGACLVLGHHPHVLQRLEVPKPGALVAYSLGNFVFDGQRGPSAESVILRCRLSRRGVVGAEVLPVRLVEGRPVPVDPSEAALMLNPLGQRSPDGAILPTGVE